MCDVALLNKYYHILLSNARILYSIAILTQQQQPFKRQVQDNSPIGVHEKRYMTSTSERAYSLIHHGGNVNGDNLMLWFTDPAAASLSNKYRMKALRGCIRNHTWAPTASIMRASSEMALTRMQALRTVRPIAVGIEKQAKMRSQSQAKCLCFEWIGEELLRRKCTG